jgi:hypothetical protein
MNHVPCFSKSGIRILPILFFIITLCPVQLPTRKGAQRRKPAAQAAVAASVQQELVRTETGFFEAWKAKDQNYFRDHMPANGIFWGDSGTFSREQQLSGSSKLRPKPALWRAMASPISECSR